MNGYVVFTSTTKNQYYINKNRTNHLEQVFSDCVVSTIEKAVDLIVERVCWKSLFEIRLFAVDLKKIESNKDGNFFLSIAKIENGEITDIIDYDKEEVRKRIVERDKKNLEDIVFNRTFSDENFNDRNIIDYLNSDLYYFFLRVDKTTGFHVDDGRYFIEDDLFNSERYSVEGVVDKSVIVWIKLKYKNIFTIQKFSEYRDKIENIFPRFFED